LILVVGNGQPGRARIDKKEGGKPAEKRDSETYYDETTIFHFGLGLYLLFIAY